MVSSLKKRVPKDATHYQWFGDFYLKKESDGTFSFWDSWKEEWERTHYTEYGFGNCLRSMPCQS